MRVRGWLLAVVAGGVLVEAIGQWLDSPPLYLRASVATLLALTAYALVAGRHSRPLVHWPVLVALAVVGVPAVTRLVEYGQIRPTVTYTGGVTFGGSPPDMSAEIAQRLFGGLRDAAPAILLFGALALAVWFLPARRRVAAGVVSLVAAALLAALSGWSLWTSAHGGWYDADGVTSVLMALAFVAPPLLVVVLALGTAVVGVQRAGPGVLAAVGVGLMTVPALVFDGPARFAGVPLPPVYASADKAVAYLAAVGPTQPSAPSLLGPLLYTAGLALAVVGCVAARGSGAGPPALQPQPPGDPA